MFLFNSHPDHRRPLEPAEAETLGGEGTDQVERFLVFRGSSEPTPLLALPALAAELGVGAIHVKDEGGRLGLGSFKALGGAYAVARLALEEAARHLGRSVELTEIPTPAVRDITSQMTFACATDGNHGRSVAQGARFVGAESVVFTHAGVSAERVAAIARFGARMVRVEGSYDQSVAEAAEVSAREGWIVVSDTSWPGYDRIPGLVMQGYTVMAREALRQLAEPPTHVFIQAGVGGVAAAIAAHMALMLGDARPRFIVVEPTRAACLFETAKAGHPVKLTPGESTVMAMLECHEPSLTAWRVLCRAADAFMTINEGEAIAVMNRLARPLGEDPIIVAGESGGVGLGGLMRAVADPGARAALGLEAASRIFVINTEGATDPDRYAELVGDHPEALLEIERARKLAS